MVEIALKHSKSVHNDNNKKKKNNNNKINISISITSFVNKDKSSAMKIKTIA